MGTEDFGDRRGHVLQERVGKQIAIDGGDQVFGDMVDFGVGVLGRLDQSFQASAALRPNEAIGTPGPDR